ncbi:MAG: glycosyltransferase involved in cell wall biosynthesis [Planctomycetota bacterium]|jgi:glycosyltransferase involved in cell wall biosynthesis
MRVGFDCSPLVRAFPLGVARACAGLLDALEKRSRLEVVRLTPADGVTSRNWRGKGLVEALRSQELAGLHSFTSAFPRAGPGLRVQTIHELPWRHGVKENADLAHRFWASFGPLWADRVLVPTEHVARDLKRRFLPGKNKIRVAPWGTGPPFVHEPAEGEIDEVLLGRYRLGEEQFLLALGAVRPKKGLARLLRGMAALKARGETPPPLVITGEETPQLRRDLGLAQQLGLGRLVSTLDTIEEADLPGLLRLALAVPVLSFSEGFGLPVLEALACGTPVIVPFASAQAEVAGCTGFAVDPDDPDAVADAIQRAGRERESLRSTLPLRAAAFSWDACAKIVEETWLELA